MHAIAGRSEQTSHRIEKIQAVGSVCKHSPRVIVVAITFLSVVTALAAPSVGGEAPPRSSSNCVDDTDTTELKERFGEQEFGPSGGYILSIGQTLPDLVWENPDLVARVIDNLAIPTRWFNQQFEEVETADEIGRYYAYGEAPCPSGPPLRRAMTCYCAKGDMNLTQVAEKWNASTSGAADAEQIRDRVETTVRRWRTSEQGAVELAALLEAEPRSPTVRRGQWQMENATRHVRLKRKLMGLDKKPVVSVAARPLSGEPAPVLRKGPLAQAEVTKAQVSALQSKLKEWYTTTSKPMAVVIARNGVIVVAEGFGTLDGQPVTVDTPMSLDSAMKPLMGLQLATYVDRGIVRLDEPIGNYLPDFDTPRDRNLTFRAGHVHVTGIHFPWDLAFSRLFYFHTWHESLIAHCRREWEPGTRYRYGVVGIILAVRSLELLRGRNYWDAMERDLFEPLGIRNVLPGGRGFSAESMARIGVLLDNRGSYGPWELISKETHQAILPTSLKDYFPDLDRKYGIGLQDESRRLGPGAYGHAGGCGTYLLVNPEEHLVFAMVRNERGTDFNRHLSEVTSQLREWIDE